MACVTMVTFATATHGEMSEERSVSELPLPRLSLVPVPLLWAPLEVEDALLLLDDDDDEDSPLLVLLLPLDRTPPARLNNDTRPGDVALPFSSPVGDARAASAVVPKWACLSLVR